MILGCYHEIIQIKGSWPLLIYLGADAINRNCIADQIARRIHLLTVHIELCLMGILIINHLYRIPHTRRHSFNLIAGISHLIFQFSPLK